MITIEIWPILEKVMLLLGIFFGIWGMYKALKYERLAKKYEPMAKQLATMLGSLSGDSKYRTKQKRLSEEAQKQVVKNIRSKIPLGLDKGLRDEHIFALMFNPDFVKGGMRLFKGVGWGLEKLGLKIPGISEEDEKPIRSYTKGFKQKKAPRMKPIK